MTNRTRAVRLFDAERHLKAARKKVTRLERHVQILTNNLEEMKPLPGTPEHGLHGRTQQRINVA